MRILKSILWVLFLTVLLLGVPRLSGVVADFFDYQAIDPDGSYAWITVHHIVQGLIFLIIILIINQFKPLDFGFGWGKREVGKENVKKFTLYFSIYTAGAYLTAILTGNLQPFQFPLTVTNIVGYLGFQLLLSGPSEELIFRAFAMTMLSLLIKGRVFNGKVSIANIIAAIIFALAHVGFSFTPFEVRYSTAQIVLSLVLGFFYGDCYEKTGSMIYPMMMHSISNVLMIGFAIILTFFMF